MTPDEPTIVDLGRLMAKRFGEYLIIDRLATGGMGTVDLAVHAPKNGIERPVALKRMRADRMMDDQFVDMFVDEVRIAARISHPHVVPLLDAGEHDGRWYYAMDLLFGVPFSQIYSHMKATTDPALAAKWPAIVLRTIADACEGLHAAHELRDENGRLLDVVHRDISPENLFVGFDGAVRVIDFGIASARDRIQATQMGQLRGKAAYIAPERLMQGATVDRRVDVWALGVTLWEALAGERLFMRDSVVSTLGAIRQGIVPPLREKRPEVPIELEEIVAKALAVDRERRYATTREMGKDILQAAEVAGWTIGLADVSEWVNELLPDAAQRQRRLAQLVTRVRRDTVEIEDDPEDDEPITNVLQAPVSPAPTPPPFPLILGLLGLLLGLGVGAVAASLLWALM